MERIFNDDGRYTSSGFIIQQAIDLAIHDLYNKIISENSGVNPKVLDYMFHQASTEAMLLYVLNKE